MYLFLALGMILLYFVQRFEDWLELTHPVIYNVSGGILVGTFLLFILYMCWSTRNEK